MARTKPAENTESTENANAELEHSVDGVTTRDGMDAGVPMIAGSPDERVGPEDAFGPGPKRGDYSDRVDSGPAMVTQDLGPQADLDTPRYRLVPAAAEAGNVGDVPGKGGVDTAEALAQPEADKPSS